MGNMSCALLKPLYGIHVLLLTSSIDGSPDGEGQGWYRFDIDLRRCFPCAT